MVFTFFKGWGKKVKRRVIFHDPWKWSDIQTSVSVSNVLPEQSHVCLCLYVSFVAAFGNSSVESLWPGLSGPQSQRYCLYSPLQKKCADLWPRPRCTTFPLPWQAPGEPLINDLQPPLMTWVLNMLIEQGSIQSTERYSGLLWSHS